MRTLLTTIALTAGLLAVPVTAQAADDCLDGAGLTVTAEVLTSAPASIQIGIGAACADEAVTVRRADGTNLQRVSLPNVYDGAPPATTGSFAAPVADGAGTWQITQVHHGPDSYPLTVPFAFVVKRGALVDVPTLVRTLPGQSVAVSGLAVFYRSTGGLAPLAGRVVQVSRHPFGGTGETVLTRTRTDSSGRFRFSVTYTREAWLVVRVWSGNAFITNGYALSEVRFRPRPTWLTGTADPTTATVVRAGTKMSTYGHLAVMYSTGGTGPFTGQKVLVQTRPKSNPTGPYGTVATATTTGTGYYYANWNASVDADVRVAFVSPYKAIASSYRWVRSLDVR